MCYRKCVYHLLLSLHSSRFCGLRPALRRRSAQRRSNWHCLASLLRLCFGTESRAIAPNLFCAQRLRASPLLLLLGSRSEALLCLGFGVAQARPAEEARESRLLIDSSDYVINSGMAHCLRASLACHAEGKAAEPEEARRIAKPELLGARGGVIVLQYSPSSR